MKAKNIIFGLSFIVLSIMGCEDKEPSNIPPPKPISVNGVSYTCEVLRPTLGWICSDLDGDKLTYTLKFGKSATNLSEEKLSNASLSKLEYTFTEELEPSEKYYWQIIVNDGKDETSGDVWDFSTIGIPKISVVPSTPVIVSPKTNTKAGNITFTWSEVADDKGMDSITFLLHVNGEETEVTGTIMKELSVEAGECTWYVIAYDEDGNGSESEHIKITLE